ncbi:hypothetical protein CKO24_06940 [Rhodothalassium salexigens DSM 2132]|nr:hypothetical protein [Rhodothalassium salexigens DSM 2132]
MPPMMNPTTPRPPRAERHARPGRMLRTTLAAGLGLLAALWGPTHAPASAQSGSEYDQPTAQLPGGVSNRDDAAVNRVAVLVNDKPITLYDISQRLRLLLATTGGVENEDQLRVLRRRVVQTLIDDKLKLNEARELDFLDQFPEEAFEQQFARQAARFNATPEQFEQVLVQVGSSREAMMEQIKAQFVWDQLVRARYGNRAAVGGDEVDAYLERLKASAGMYEYRLAEIQLLVQDPRDRPRIRSTAAQLVNQIQAGELDFATAAIQFSQSTTAANGGNLGWIPQDQLRPAWAEVVPQMEPDTIAGPVATPGAFFILQLQDRRRILSADPLDAQLDLARALTSFDETTTQEQVERIVETLNKELDGFGGCDDLPSIAQRAGLDQVFEPSAIPLRSLRKGIRDRVKDLDVGQATRPMVGNDGIMVMAVCGKSAPEVQMPAFDEIRNRMEGERLAAFARRYIRDLKRDAVIDYRVPKDQLF